MVVVVGVCIRCAGVIFNSKSPIDLQGNSIIPSSWATELKNLCA